MKAFINNYRYDDLWRTMLLNAIMLILFGAAVIIYPVILAIIVATFFVVAGISILVWSLRLKKATRGIGYCEEYYGTPFGSRSFHYVKIRRW